MLKNRLDDYDVEAWQRFYADNPGFHRSVGADGDGDAGDGDAGSAGGDAGDGDAGSGDSGGAGNWRDPFLTGIEDDEALAKEKKRLERFTKPADLYNSYRDLENKVRAGEVLKPLPKDATEDDIKRYREQMGIPDDPKGYLAELPDGLVIGEDDAEFFEDFAGALHEVNASPEIAHKAVEWYNGFKEKAAAARQESDEQAAEEMEDALRSPDEWGNDYRKNVNIVNGFIDATFGDGAEAFRNARNADGVPLMSDMHVMRGLVDMARQLNPGAALVENASDPNQSLDDAIAQIEKTMREDRAAYNKNEKMQERYRQLLTARQKRDERAA